MVPAGLLTYVSEVTPWLHRRNWPALAQARPFVMARELSPSNIFHPTALLTCTFARRDGTAFRRPSCGITWVPVHGLDPLSASHRYGPGDGTRRTSRRWQLVDQQTGYKPVLCARAPHWP